eukprot:CAMPEP_0114517046 /NCGR_PEP_ID=MMETSP0109-20121206/17674_1 /TAXON_ID=29199 /ORGANISM="Chlorarachnion reptans, Strain CCCM449" /LENGTH=332 /DNA_ID=CAMNT_0001697519 /DNA_START=609 /DNA_END=1607 /DNA_ORIENTATION=-
MKAAAAAAAMSPRDVAFGRGRIESNERSRSARPSTPRSGERVLRIRKTFARVRKKLNLMIWISVALTSAVASILVLFIVASVMRNSRFYEGSSYFEILKLLQIISYMSILAGHIGYNWIEFRRTPAQQGAPSQSSTTNYSGKKISRVRRFSATYSHQTSIIRGVHDHKKPVREMYEMSNENKYAPENSNRDHSQSEVNDAPRRLRRKSLENPIEKKEWKFLVPRRKTGDTFANGKLTLASSCEPPQTNDRLNASPRSPSFVTMPTTPFHRRISDSIRNENSNPTVRQIPNSFLDGTSDTGSDFIMKKNAEQPTASSAVSMITGNVEHLQVDV